MRAIVLGAVLALAACRPMISRVPSVFLQTLTSVEEAPLVPSVSNCAAKPRTIKADEFPQLLNDMGLNGEGAEVGVDSAGNVTAAQMSGWPGSKLYMVYPFFQEVPYQNSLAGVSRSYDSSNKFDVVSIREPDAPSKFKDGSLDWVFVSRNRTHNSVMEQLAAWYPKVKIGGMIAGDNYVDGPQYKPTPEGWGEPVAEERAYVSGVLSAVNKFTTEKGEPYLVSSYVPPKKKPFGDKCSTEGSPTIIGGLYYKCQNGVMQGGEDIPNPMWYFTKCAGALPGAAAAASDAGLRKTRPPKQVTVGVPLPTKEPCATAIPNPDAFPQPDPSNPGSLLPADPSIPEKIQPGDPSYPETLQKLAAATPVPVALPNSLPVGPPPTGPIIATDSAPPADVGNSPVSK